MNERFFMIFRKYILLIQIFYPFKQKEKIKV